jgi:hypothetical protein
VVAIATPVDVERLLVAKLLTDTPLTTLVGTRISTEVPASPTFPLVTLKLITTSGDFPHWLENALIQADSWGGTRQQANDVACTLQAAMKRAEGTTASGLGVVSGVEPSGRSWQPDATVTPARPRYVSQFRVYLHPLP